MCLAGTRKAVRSRADDAHERGGGLSRRALLGAGLGAGLMASLPMPPAAARRVPSRRMADLTQTFADAMPTFDDDKPSREVVSPPAGDGEFGFYLQRWQFAEHVGTHVDAPGHVIGGARLSPDLQPEELLVPAVVINVRREAADNPNAVVTVDDVVAFERRHGRIPTGAAVLMDSGWAQRWDDGDAAYRGTDDGEAPLNFPGFSADACEYLIERRDIAGVGVDTLSTDPGESQEFPAHEVLGRGDRWGIENLANLGVLPPRGATLVVGLVPWAEGSGGPCRAFAFW